MLDSPPVADGGLPAREVHWEELVDAFFLCSRKEGKISVDPSSRAGGEMADAFSTKRF